MNELFKRLGMQLEFEQCYIRLITPPVYIVPDSNNLTGLGLYITPTPYSAYMSYNPPVIHWKYTTRFGDEYAQYIAKQNPYVLPSYTYSQTYQGGFYTSSGISGLTGGLLLSGAALSQQQAQYQQAAMQQSQLSLSGQLQQASLQQNVQQYTLPVPLKYSTPAKEVKLIHKGISKLKSIWQWLKTAK